MEFILFGVLAKIGFGFIVIATLILLAVHALEHRSATTPETGSTRHWVDSGNFRLHHFPQVQHAQTARNLEEPTQRAA